MFGQRRRRWASVKRAAGQRLVFAGYTRCSPYAGLMLGQRRRRWPNIKSAHFKRHVFAEYTWYILLCKRPVL